MRLPTTISVTCKVDQKPMPGLMILVTTKTRRKNDFSAMFGPTDAHGNLTIRWEEVLKQAEESRRLFVMDYGDPETDFAGEIQLRVVNREGLRLALDAYRLFRNATDYPFDWEQRLNRADEILAKLPLGTKITIKAKHDGTRIKMAVM